MFYATGECLGPTKAGTETWSGFYLWVERELLDDSGDPDGILQGLSIIRQKLHVPENDQGNLFQNHGWARVLRLGHLVYSLPKWILLAP